MQGPLNVEAVYRVVAIFLGATKQTVGVYFKSVYDHFLLINHFPFITPYHYILPQVTSTYNTVLQRQINVKNNEKATCFSGFVEVYFKIYFIHRTRRALFPFTSLADIW